MPARAPDFRPGQRMPGTKYEIVKELGVGGMGVVYQVKKPPEIPGVLKLMSSDLAAHEEFRLRFWDEVRVLAKLDHPNIVKVSDYDALEDGTPFYVMELLHGSTVRDVLSSMGRLPPRAAFEITRQLLEALHCAHTHDVPVVHRDIKPENIFLHAPPHDEPVVKLIDFGVVAIADRKHDGTFVGTWRYAAPEQIRGERAIPATDLYAVGLVLYEMLVGAGPFDHVETGTALSHAHLFTVPEPVSHPAPWVPASVVALVASALAKDPKDRPRDAHAFAERLYELEWATDGSVPSARTLAGPLSRALSSVSAEPIGLPSSGSVLAAAPAKHEPTSPDDDALLDGLLAPRAQEPFARRFDAPLRDGEDGIASGRGGAPSARTFDAGARSSDPKLIPASGRLESETPTLERALPRESRSDPRRLLAVGGIAAVIALLGVLSLVWVRHRASGRVQVATPSVASAVTTLTTVTAGETTPAEATAPTPDPLRGTAQTAQTPALASSHVVRGKTAGSATTTSPNKRGDPQPPTPSHAPAAAASNSAGYMRSLIP